MNVLLVKDGVTPKNLVIAAAAANVASELGCTSHDYEWHGWRPQGRELPLYGGSARFSAAAHCSPQARIRNRMQRHLGPAYQVIVETDHIHVEYDPKRKNP
jgi:hypothetical protein